MARARPWLILGGLLALLALRGALGEDERGARDAAGGAPMLEPAAAETGLSGAGAVLRGDEAPAGAVAPSAAPPERRAARPAAGADARPLVLGTVVDARGAPLAGAEVAFFDAALYGSDRPASLAVAHPSRRARTGADGRFAFPAADAERRHGVQVFAPGFVPKGRNQSPGIDAPFELAPAAALLGRVVGPDAAGAEVTYRGAAWVDGALVEGALLASDGAGGYAARNLPVGRPCELEVKPSAGPPFEVSVPIEAPGEAHHDIELGPIATVMLRVTHAFTGAPVAGAGASLIWRGRRIELARSDAEGWLRIAMQEGSPRGPEPAAAERPASWRALSIHAPGMLATVAPWPAPGAPASERNVRLVPSARLRGTVLSAAGEPLAGAEVRWIAPLQVMDPDVGVLENGPESFRALAGPDGRFDLPDVLWAQPDAVAGVWIEGERRCAVFDAAPRGPGETRELELRLLGAPALAGRVLLPRRDRRLWRSAQPAGEPALPEARVRAVPASGEEPLAGPCDAAGAFLLAGVAPGEYEVTASDALGRRAEPVRVLVPGLEAETLELVLYPPPRTLSGRILTHDGRPWSGALEVSATGVGWRRARARAGADGFFSAELVVLPEDELVVSIDLGDADLRRALPPAGGMVWTLPEVVPVRVGVVPAAGGDGAASVAPLRFRWRRPFEGDESTIMLPSALVRLPLEEGGMRAPDEVQGNFAGLAELGYVRFSAPAVTHGDQVELELPRGTLDLWLELPGDPRREVERRVELPADAPDGVLLIEL